MGSSAHRVAPEGDGGPNLDHEWIAKTSLRWSHHLCGTDESIEFMAMDAYRLIGLRKASCHPGGQILKTLVSPL
jgi:hypothetical protein